MHHLKQFKPSPTAALLVASVALFAAIGGVGYSAVTASKNSVKTKSIRNGAVTTPKLAPDAKVAFAGTADTADTAKTADNVTRIGGVPAGDLATASGYDTASGLVNLTTGFKVIDTVHVTTTGAKRLIGTGTVEGESSSTDSDFIECEVDVDGTDGQLEETYLLKNGFFGTMDGTVASQGSAIVDAGTHDVFLLCKTDGTPNGKLTDSSLAVTAVSS